MKHEYWFWPVLGFVIGACDPRLQDVDTDIDGIGSDPVEDIFADTTPIVDKQTLVGRSSLISFNQDYWTQPPNVGPALGAYVPAFLLTVTTVNSDGTFEGLLGTAKDDGTQDMCSKTATVAGTLTDTASTTFSVNAADFDAILTGPMDQTNRVTPKVIASIHGLSLGGTFINRPRSIRRAPCRSRTIPVCSRIPRRVVIPWISLFCGQCRELQRSLSLRERLCLLHLLTKGSADDTDKQ